MHDNRVVPRTRRIAYDLRRKVLLKNFLKEQLIHSASSNQALEQNDSSIPAGNSEIAVNLTRNEVQVDAVSSTSELQLPSTSSATEKENGQKIESDSVEKCDNTATTSGFEKSIFPFSRLKNALRMPSKASRIVKAKRNHKPFKGSCKPFRRQPEPRSSDNESSPGRKRSLFSLFKSKKVNKRRRAASSFRNFFPLRNSSQNYRTSSTSTAVQTDLEWTESALDTMHQSNQCLREENRLLSESLNNIMTGINFTLEKCGKPSSACTDLYDSSFSRPKQRDRTLAKAYARPLDNIPHSKVLRSKSIHERSEYRERIPPLRSRSLNRARPYPIPRYHPPPSDVCRDSSHFPNLRTRSTDHRVLRSLPVAPSNRPLLRRSSMPERPSNRTDRVRLRSNSIREESRSSYRPSEGTGYRLANYTNRSRNFEWDSYSQHVPIQHLPPEAFY